MEREVRNGTRFEMRWMWECANTHIKLSLWCRPGKSASHYGKYVGCGLQFRYISANSNNNNNNKKYPREENPNTSQSYSKRVTLFAYVFNSASLTKSEAKKKRHCGFIYWYFNSVRNNVCCVFLSWSNNRRKKKLNRFQRIEWLVVAHFLFVFSAFF